MTKPKLTPEKLRSVFLDLQAINLNPVVVGGQALNLWATKYYNRSPDLKKLLPFASEDLDFYGGRLEVISCRDALQGEARLSQDFDPSPNSGLVLVKRQDLNLRIDFLASVYGLNDAEIESTAVQFSGQEQLAGVNIRVLHPILCLEGKLRALRGLPQQGRQDLKHVKMAIFCLREFLSDFCQRSEPRSGLKLVERTLGSAVREDGLSAWYRHEIQIETAIPFETIATIAEEKWQRFRQQRLPQLMRQIATKRQHYQALMRRTVAKESERTTITPEGDTFTGRTGANSQSESSVSSVEKRNRELRNLTAVILGRQLLTTLGQATYESEHYYFSSQGESITVTAKDGRGLIARASAGAIAGSVSPEDINQLKQLNKAISFPETPQSEPSPPNFDEEIDN